MSRRLKLANEPDHFSKGQKLAGAPHNFYCMAKARPVPAVILLIVGQRVKVARLRATNGQPTVATAHASRRPPQLMACTVQHVKQLLCHESISVGKNASPLTIRTQKPEQYNAPKVGEEWRGGFALFQRKIHPSTYSSLSGLAMTSRKCATNCAFGNFKCFFNDWVNSYTPTSASWRLPRSMRYLQRIFVNVEAVSE